jgi:hypothetical protein
MQGDQIRQIFAYWVIIRVTSLGDFLPIVLFGQFFEK